MLPAALVERARASERASGTKLRPSLLSSGACSRSCDALTKTSSPRGSRRGARARGSALGFSESENLLPPQLVLYFRYTRGSAASAALRPAEMLRVIEFLDYYNGQVAVMAAGDGRGDRDDALGAPCAEFARGATYLMDEYLEHVQVGLPILLLNTTTT